MGYRKCTDKPIIHLKKKGETIPFDVNTVRTFEYDLTDLDNVEETKKRLEQTIGTFSFENKTNALGQDEENNKLNRGHYFEKLVADFFGDCYVLNNTPYYLAGDVTTKKGIEIQCKFTGATVISEEQINK